MGVMSGRYCRHICVTVVSSTPVFCDTFGKMSSTLEAGAVAEPPVRVRLPYGSVDEELAVHGRIDYVDFLRRHANHGACGMGSERTSARKLCRVHSLVSLSSQLTVLIIHVSNLLTILAGADEIVIVLVPMRSSGKQGARERGQGA